MLCALYIQPYIICNFEKAKARRVVESCPPRTVVNGEGVPTRLLPSSLLIAPPFCLHREKIGKNRVHLGWEVEKVFVR